MKAFAEILPCDDSSLERAAALLNSGGVAVIPTDTVYGLAAHPDFPDAVARLYSIKQREARKPIALLASDVAALSARGFALSGKAGDLAARYWPGALTLVVENAQGQTEGFRVPDHVWTRRLIEKCGGLLRVTSANLSGSSPATSSADAFASLGLETDIVFDDGPSSIGVASTVVRTSPDGTLRVLRQGSVPA